MAGLNARVWFIRHPAGVGPGSTGSVVVVDFADSDLPVADGLRLLREVNRCTRAEHIRVLERSSRDHRNALASLVRDQHRANAQRRDNIHVTQQTPRSD